MTAKAWGAGRRRRTQPLRKPVEWPPVPNCPQPMRSRIQPVDGAPQRVQLSRRKGWRLPPNTVVVSRPGRWGNPHKLSAGVPATREARAEVVNKFRVYLEGGALPYDAAEVRSELRGKNLACWCKLGAPCHADVLLAIANGVPRK